MSKRTKWLHPLWSRYRLIKYHCEDTNSPRYHLYGGRGIKLKATWSRDFFQFADWCEHNIGLPTSYREVLERINNNGDYRPGNLRWSTSKENCNNRTNNTLIKIGRQTQTLTAWCEQEQMWMGTVLRRIHVMGLEPRHALGIEPHSRCRPSGARTRIR